MDRNALRLISKRTVIESNTPASTINNSFLATQTLKANSNIRTIIIPHTEKTDQTENSVGNQQSRPYEREHPAGTKANDRPLKCLETLAQKAGITFDDKYDFSSPPHSRVYSSNHHCTRNSISLATSTSFGAHINNFSHRMEKPRSPAQQMATSTLPLQISPEHLQQLQQLQLQHGSPFAAIQVKQEFPTHSTHQLGGTGCATDLKHPAILDQNHLQQMQMQLDSGASVSPATQHTPNSAPTAMQQHSTTISTMSPMHLTTAGQMQGDWGQGRTVQLMQPSTSALNSGFLYHPQMLVSGNLIHSTGLGQQPIQVIAAGKPFQSGTPQMITTTQNAKQMLGGNSGFPNGTYATLPTIPTSQSPQTLLFSPVNVISQTQQQQQQNIFQTMAAAAAQQQQQQQQQSNKVVGADTQKSMQQKVVQKVTTTTNTVQSATSTGGVAAVAQQQQQQSTQQCMQVSQATMPTTQIISPLQATGAPQQMQISAPWVQSVPFWAANGLQQLTQNPIIIRGTQADGTQGMFIQQPANNQTLQAQQPNQITLQCNVAQTPTKPKQQTQQQQVSQPQAAAATQQQHHQQQLQQQQQQHQQQPQQRTQQILPQNGAQIRPASSVSTQTAQNQSLLKHKMRNKQQLVRPALPAMKSDVGQQQSKIITAPNSAGLHQQLTSIAQPQQPQPTMHQVVTSAGNKVVVMSAGTPITIQNGQTISHVTANQVDKQQIQLQQIKQQQQQQQVLLQQQLLQQQLAHIQLQQHQTQQIQLQMTPQNYIAQQQQQIQHQIIQQQTQQQHQQQHHSQSQQQHNQQQQQQQLQTQREHQQQQNTGIIHQIVVQQSPQQQQQQQQPQMQQQITAVPFSVSTSIPSIIGTQNNSLQQHVAYQSKTNTTPTSSVVTISNQMGPMVTSTVGGNQDANIQHQNPMTANMPISHNHTQMGPPFAAITQSQLQQQQKPHQSNIPSSPSENPILAMASMTNAAIVGTTTTNALSLPVSCTASSLPSSSAKTTARESHPYQEEIKTLPTPSVVVTKESNQHSIPTNPEMFVEAPPKSPHTCGIVPIKTTSISLQLPLESSPHTTTTFTTNAVQLFSEPPHKKSNTPLTSNETPTISRASSPPNKESKSQDDTKKPTNSEVQAPITSPICDESIVLKTIVVGPTKPVSSGTSSKTEKDLPKAMIKPNVLTHVIDGFIIQEANEPFPLTRQRYADKDPIDEPPKKKKALEENTATTLSKKNSVVAEMVPCEKCGTHEHKNKLKKKRYCSLACARLLKASVGEHHSVDASYSTRVLANKSSTANNNNANGDGKDTVMHSSISGKDKADIAAGSAASTMALHSGNAAPLVHAVSNSPATTDAPAAESSLMFNWSVSDVCDFIKNLPGCSDYVDDFEQQEIDGQALLLLKENHLVNAMGMKLGPALKIVAKVESMKESATCAGNLNVLVEE